MEEKFNSFKKWVRNMVARSGEKVRVTFYTDTEKGMFIAKCSDGNTISMNFSGNKVMVREPHGRKFITAIAG